MANNIELPEGYNMGVAQSRRDWAARIGEMKWIRITGTLAPGATEFIPVYTIPTGKKFYWCGTFASTNFQGYSVFRLVPLGLESGVWSQGFKPFINYVDPAVKLPAGTTINVKVNNLDIINGDWNCEIYAYETDV